MNEPREARPAPPAPRVYECEGCDKVMLRRPTLCIQEHQHYLCGWCAEAMRAAKGWDEYQPCPDVLTDDERILATLRRSTRFDPPTDA